MLIDHDGRRPVIDATARIAPTAVVCGEVTIGKGSSIGFGAVLTAETGPVSIGEHCVVMENAVLRGTKRAPLRIGDHVLVGPHAHLSGCVIGDSVFLATGASVFPFARIGDRSVVRIGAVVHIRANLPAGSSIPIHGIAAGDPAEIVAGEHQAELLARLAGDFSATVFGIEREETSASYLPRALARYTRALSRHHQDRVLPPD